jgi:hypothetical protein
LSLVLIIGAYSSVAHGAGGTPCQAVTAAELNTLKLDFEAYANGSLTVDAFVMRHKEGKANLAILLYMLWIEKDNSREEVDKAVGFSTEETLSGVVNYVLYKYSWENDKRYKDALHQFVRIGYIGCLIPDDNPLVIVARYTFGDSLGIADPDQRKLRYLRAGATISAEYLRRYVDALQRADAARFEIERLFWSEQANLCSSDRPRDTCTDQIVGYANENARKSRLEGTHQILCNLVIVGPTEAWTADICVK